jgi:hypothetical protein
MDNLAPHTKRLAETAMGGPPIAANQQQQQSQSSQQQQTQRVHVTTPASMSNVTDNNSVAGTPGALAGSLVSAPGVTLAKTTLLGRAASMTMNKQLNRRRSLFDDDKVTDQGSASQVSISYVVVLLLYKNRHQLNL